MTALGLARKTLVRTGKLAPLGRLLVVGELAVQAGRHLAKLGPAERARLLTLLRQGRGRPGALDDGERRELFELIARMEPHVFMAAAAARLSPIPVPRRLLVGGAHVAGRALRRRR